MHARRIFDQNYFENKKLVNELNKDLKIVTSELATFIAKSAKAKSDMIEKASCELNLAVYQWSAKILYKSISFPE